MRCYNCHRFHVKFVKKTLQCMSARDVEAEYAPPVSTLTLGGVKDARGKPKKRDRSFIFP